MHMSIIAAATVLVTGLAAQAQEPAQPQNLVTIADGEAAAHLIGEWPFLRVSRELIRGGLFSGLGIEVRVDTNGVVTSAQADKDAKNFPPEIQGEAESLVRSLKFSPFTEHGRSVMATFLIKIGLLPPEDRPSRHVPFPEVTDLKLVKITLRRDACFGTCPSYKIEIDGDGSVLYQGDEYVAIKGRRRASISKSDVRQLIKAFEDADYFSLKDHYYYEVSDWPTCTTSIEIGGVRKQVLDYLGIHDGMPMAVSRLEAEIDRVSGSARWVTGHAKTKKSAP